MPKVSYLLALGTCLALLPAGGAGHVKVRLTRLSLDEALSIAVLDNPILR